MTTAPTTASFQAKLEARVSAVNSLLCVGLDPHEAELFPNNDNAASTSTTQRTSQQRCDAAFSFCKTLVDLTLPYAACYKPNAAFFEALGAEDGMAVLRRVCKQVIPSDVPILLDVKRGDIGSTAAAYATACYDHVGADAVTLSPLMGWDSIAPFVTGAKKYSNRGAFLLCKTSNPGSQDLLALNLKSSNADDDDETLYERIAKLTGGEWSNKCSSDALLGLVVGATDTVAMQRVRKAAGPNVWILAPGVGAQGGNLKQAVQAGINRTTGSGLLIPVSRGISRAEDPAKAAKELAEQIQAVVQEVVAAAASSSDTTAAAATSNEDNENILPHQREFLEYSLAQGVLKFGSFVLKSGRTSPYFFNAGLFATGAALYRVGKAYASTIMESSALVDGATKQPKFDVIFGPAYKGISLAAVVSSALYSDFGVDVGYAYNRKEAKSHGEGGNLVGAAMANKRVLIVDDVITAGTAIRESHTMLQEIQAQPMAVVIALDRAEKRSLDDPVSAVQAVARDLKLPVVSIVNLPQLQTFLEKSPAHGEEHLERVAAYRTEYGV